MAKKTTASKPKKATTAKKANETELKAEAISSPKLSQQKEESTVTNEVIDTVTNEVMGTVTNEVMDTVTPIIENTDSDECLFNEGSSCVSMTDEEKAPKPANDLSTYQLSELLAFRDANGIIIAYYDNLVKSCTGNYDATTKAKYGEWMKMRTTYQNLDLKILEEIEKRVNLLL